MSDSIQTMIKNVKNARTMYNAHIAEMVLIERKLSLTQTPYYLSPMYPAQIRLEKNLAIELEKSKSILLARSLELMLDTVGTNNIVDACLRGHITTVLELVKNDV